MKGSLTTALILIAASANGIKGLALSPKPCEDQTLELPSGVKLEVTVDDWETPTRVYAADGTLLYEMNSHPCHSDIFLSSNGAILIFDGNYYFPQWMNDPNSNRSSDVVISSIFLNGQKQRDVMYFAELKGHLIDQESDYYYSSLIRDYGYVPRQFEISKVNWDQNTIVYTGQATKVVPLVIFDDKMEALAKLEMK